MWFGLRHLLLIYNSSQREGSQRYEPIMVIPSQTPHKYFARSHRLPALVPEPVMACSKASKISVTWTRYSCEAQRKGEGGERGGGRRATKWKEGVGWCQCYRQEKLRRQRRRFSQVNYRKFLEWKYIHSRDVRIGLNIGAVVFFYNAKSASLDLLFK